MPPMPLATKRIVVTRAGEQAASTIQRLQALGAEVIGFPTIAFEPLPGSALRTALQELANYDWLIFSSSNAVRFFLDACEQYAPAAALPPIAAVGKATAALLADHGLPVAFVPAEFSGVALAHGLGPLPGRRILLPRARTGRQEIVLALQEAGAQVDDIAIYDTVMPPADPDALQSLARGFDAILFASPSAVRNFLSLVAGQAAIQRHLQRAVIAAIGPTTAQACHDAGLPVHVQPTTYTMPALIQALTAFWRQGEEQGGQHVDG